MDLSKLTKQEIIALKLQCENELKHLNNRIKRKIYIIGFDGASEHCFKEKEEAIEWLLSKIDDERKSSDSIFCDEIKLIIKTDFIDEIEYDKQPDSWIYV